jgi:hypothetical protein
MVSISVYTINERNGRVNSDQSVQEDDAVGNEGSGLMCAQVSSARARAADGQRYGSTPEVARRWVRAAELPSWFCSWDLAYRCTAGGWLKPIIQGKRRTIYRLADVLRCLRRIEAGEMPPRRSGRNTAYR